MSTTTTQRVTSSQATPARPGHPAADAVARAMRHLASWRVWLASASLFALFAGVFFGSTAPFAIPTVEAACGQAPPDVRFTSSAAEVGGFLEACGVAGREAYRAMQVADVVYPLVFALFIASSLALVISRLAPRRRSLLAVAALPLVASAFDYVENACAWLALASYPDTPATSSLLGLASAAKTATSWAAGVLLLGALGALLVVTLRRLARPRAHELDSDDSTEASQ